MAAILELMPFFGYYRAAKINSAYLNTGRRFTLSWAELSKAFRLNKIQNTFLCNIATIDYRLFNRLLLGFILFHLLVHFVINNFGKFHRGDFFTGLNEINLGVFCS